jgi:hypothetical protein
MEARAQLMEYARYFDEAQNRTFIEGQYGIMVYRPRMFVVIGRRGNVSPIIRRSAELSAEDIHLRTYDDVIDRIRYRVKSMQLPESVHPRIDAILERATNVLSVIHPHVYFLLAII